MAQCLDAYLKLVALIHNIITIYRKHPDRSYKAVLRGLSRCSQHLIAVTRTRDYRVCLGAQSRFATHDKLYSAKDLLLAHHRKAGDNRQRRHVGEPRVLSHRQRGVYSRWCWKNDVPHIGCGCSSPYVALPGGRLAFHVPHPHYNVR